MFRKYRNYKLNLTTQHNEYFKTMGKVIINAFHYVEIIK